MLDFYQDYKDYLPIAAIIISTFALIFTTRNYLRKSGLSIRGAFVPCSSVYCKDTYITKVMLENLKDRSVVIYAIYLRLGFSYYLKLEDFENSPLVLKAYEVYSKDFEPIHSYGANMNNISIETLFEKNVNKKIVLSTSEGKYIVSSWVRHWNPIQDFFINNLTTIIYPRYAKYKNHSIGSNIDYILHFNRDQDNEEIVMLRKSDYSLVLFKDFQLTKDSLENAHALKCFLENLLNKGIIKHKVEVIDIKTYLKNDQNEELQKTIVARPYRWLTYKLLGRVVTLCHRSRIKRKNSSRNK